MYFRVVPSSTPVLLAVIVALSTIPESNSSPNPPEYTPPNVTLKRDVRVRVFVEGKPSGMLSIKKGEILDVVETTRSGFMVKKGGYDPVELKRYEVERVREVEKIAPPTPTPDAFSSNYRKQKPKLGNLREFGAMVEDAWSDNGVKKKMFVWQGREIVFLTTTSDLEPEVMQKLVDALDAGWRFYKNTVRLTPSQTELSRKFGGRGVFVAVPDYRFVGNTAALGYLGAIGIEVALFYQNQFGSKSDYLKLKEDGLLPDYYFYEMGRNFYLFGESHQMFATGFAVAMSILCLDEVSSHAGVSPHPRRISARHVEKSFSDSGASWGESLSDLGSSNPILLRDTSGAPLPSNLSDLYASMVLFLYDNFGGQAWLEKYYGFLTTAPPSPKQLPGGIEGQMLNMVIAANLAAGRDLSGIFRDRWRLPLKGDIFEFLGSVDWTSGDVMSTLTKIPAELLPPPLASASSEFVARSGEERVLIDGSAESLGKKAWLSIQTGRPASSSDFDRRIAKAGKSCLVVEGGAWRAGWKQAVKLTPGKMYVVSAWVKTENLVPLENSNAQGAFICASSKFRSVILKGNSDWSRLGLLFVQEGEGFSEIELVVDNSAGRAFFDDVNISEAEPMWKTSHNESPWEEGLQSNSPLSPAPRKFAVRP